MKGMKAGLVAALVAAGSSCGPLGAGPLRIGAVYPTGGGQGPGGTQELRGVRLAAELANRKGGVGGRRVELVTEEADSSDAAAPAIGRLAGRGVNLVLGSYGSTISRPASESAAGRGMLFWETGAVGELPMAPGGSRLIFRFPPTGASLGKAAVGFVSSEVVPRLAASPGPLRWSVAYVDDVYGRAVGQGALAEIAASHLALAGSFPYSLAHLDFDALARSIASAHTDVLVVAAYLDDGVALRRAILSQKIHLAASIGTSSSYCMPEFGAGLGQSAVGLFASDKPEGSVVREDALTPEAASVLRWGNRRYQELYHEPMSAPALSGFAAAWALFHHVLPAASGPSPREVSAAARRVRVPAGGLPNGSGLDFSGPDGAAASLNLRAASVIWEWTQPGTRTVVWPPAFATGPAQILPIG